MIFTWWNKLTLGTFLKTLFSGKFVGKDEFGINITKTREMKDGWFTLRR